MISLAGMRAYVYIICSVIKEFTNYYFQKLIIDPTVRVLLSEKSLDYKNEHTMSEIRGSLSETLIIVLIYGFVGYVGILYFGDEGYLNCERRVCALEWQRYSEHRKWFSLISFYVCFICTLFIFRNVPEYKNVSRETISRIKGIREILGFFLVISLVVCLILEKYMKADILKDLTKIILSLFVVKFANLPTELKKSKN